MNAAAAVMTAALTVLLIEVPSRIFAAKTTARRSRPHAAPRHAVVIRDTAGPRQPQPRGTLHQRAPMPAPAPAPEPADEEPAVSDDDLLMRPFVRTIPVITSEDTVVMGTVP